MLSAYKDNAAVMEGSEVGRFFADREAGRYDFPSGARAYPDESGNPQPPDGDLPVAGRGDRLRR